MLCRARQVSRRKRNVFKIATSNHKSRKLSAKPKAAIPVDELSFEAALKELEDIVGRLEQGEVDLEDSIALYERGQALKGHCEKKLKAAESRLEKIVHGANGAISTEPVDLGSA
jgi:exodeoxyribonuclease VII small subunit